MRERGRCGAVWGAEDPRDPDHLREAEGSLSGFVHSHRRFAPTLFPEGFSEIS